MDKPSKHTRLLFMLLGLILAMAGLSFASVPLYRIFCNATGLGGTTQRAQAAPQRTPQQTPQQNDDREVTINFDGNVDESLAWDFVPEIRHLTIKLGQVATVKYRARNLSDKALVGTATFNVQPSKVGAFFDKIQCFCFTQQILKPGETVELPVQFFVDPAMAGDAQYADVREITLSYTFFLAKDQSKVQAINASDINLPDTLARPKGVSASKGLP